MIAASISFQDVRGRRGDFLNLVSMDSLALKPPYIVDQLPVLVPAKVGQIMNH